MSQDLDKIKVMNTKLFKVPDSNMYKFCIDRNITTLKELFDYIDKFGVDSKKMVVCDEILGIVDLLKYKYSYVDLQVMDILNSKFQKNDFFYANGKNNWISSKQLNLFRRLGFSQEESKTFIIYSNRIDNDLTVGEMLSLYIEKVKNFDNSYYESYYHKIFLLVDYYKNNSLMYNNMENLKKLYDDLIDKIKQRNEIDKIINSKKLEIKKMLDVVSLVKEDEQKIALRKKWNNQD